MNEHVQNCHQAWAAWKELRQPQLALTERELRVCDIAFLAGFSSGLRSMTDSIFPVEIEGGEVHFAAKDGAQ